MSMETDTELADQEHMPDPMRSMTARLNMAHQDLRASQMAERNMSAHIKLMHDFIVENHLEEEFRLYTAQQKISGLYTEETQS